MNRASLYFQLLVLFSCNAFSQDKLTLDQAVEIALKNNFSILIARGQSGISANNATRGHAGMLPQVSLNASGNLASNTTAQQYSSGLEVNRSGVASSSVSSGVALNWTLFDGMRMFAAYDRLKVLKDMGELNLKVQIEGSVSGVITAYYDVVRHKQLIMAAASAISRYEERERIALMKFNIGSGSKLEAMQARVDLNAQRSLLLKLQTTLFNAKAKLNQFLARAPETDFETGDSIPVTYDPKFEELKSGLTRQNSMLLFAERNINVFDYSLREARALRYPRLGITSSYVFSRSENQAGFVLLNQNLGFNAGFSATWNLFSGFEVRRQVREAEIQLMIGKLEYDMLKIQTDAALASAYRNFRQARELLALEEENARIAQENVDIAIESFRIGKISTLELKDIQRSADDAQVRLVNTRYEVKLAETELMRLNGMLVK